jgi:hypothetical protein
MKAAMVFDRSSEFRRAPRRRSLVLLLGLAPLFTSHAALADSEEEQFAPFAVAAPVDTDRGPRLELSAAPIPNLDNIDTSAGTTRLDLTSWPRKAQDSMLGVSLGLSVPSSPSLDSRVQPQSVDVGLRWRSTMDNTRRLDVSAWRRVTPVPDAITLIQGKQPDLYGTRVEMQFTTGRSRIVPELGAIGMQLSGGAKLSLRAKHGKPMLYYRARF